LVYHFQPTDGTVTKSMWRGQSDNGMQSLVSIY